MTGSSINGRAVVSANPEALARAAANWFLERTRETEDTMRIALSGGSTPKAFFRMLTSHDYLNWIAWDRLEFFWGDERFVPHYSPDSNFHMAREALLAQV